MIRKQVYIEPWQDALLKRLARSRGMSEAEIIRQAIDREAGAPSAIPGKPDLEAWEEVRALIQAMVDQGPVAGKRRWNRDQLYGERLNHNGRERDS
jgi:hypothetical protein